MNPRWRAVVLGLAIGQTQCDELTQPCLSVAYDPDDGLDAGDGSADEGLDAGIGPCLSQQAPDQGPLDGSTSHLPPALDRAALLAKVIDGLPADVAKRLREHT